MQRNTVRKPNNNNQYIQKTFYRIWNNKCYCALVTTAILSSIVIATSIVFFLKLQVMTILNTIQTHKLQLHLHLQNGQQRQYSHKKQQVHLQEQYH